MSIDMDRHECQESVAALDFETGAGPDILENALAYRRAGLSVVPVPPDGSKWPNWHEITKFGAPGWKWFAEHLPTEEHVRRWFAWADRGIGVVAGPASGNLEFQDWDDHGGQLGTAFEDWRHLVQEIAPGLYERLWIGRTPRGNGNRVGYRCDTPLPEKDYSKLLAMVPSAEDPNKYETLCEWLALGKIVLVPGGHPDAHPCGKPYTTVQGDLCDLPVITAAERMILVEAARSLDRREKRAVSERKDDLDSFPEKQSSGTRPGDEFNARGTWEEILEPHGWTYSHTMGDVSHWCRPGKNDGVSATTNYAGNGLLHVFTSNAPPFEPDRSYSKFTAFALLNHDGDFAEAAKVLAARGYGKDGWATEPAADSPAARIRAEVLGMATDDRPVICDNPPAVPNVPAVDLDRYREDGRCQYLWEGYHGKYLTDDQRAARIRSIEDAWRFVPPTGVIPEYMRWVLPTTDAPPVFHVAAALGLAGHLLNRRVWLPTGHSRLYPNLWIAVIGESSKQRKSTAIEPVLRVVGDDPAYSRTVLPKAFTMEAMFAKLGHVLDRPEDIVPHRKKCKERDDEGGFLDGVGVFHVDELGGFLQTLDKSYNEGGKVILTEWYDCPPEWHKPTRTQGTYYLWRPTVTILAASTLQWLLDNCQESDLMGGFLPRWLFVGHRGGRDYTLALRDRPSEEAWFRVTEEAGRLKAVGGEASLSEGAEKLYWDWRSAFEKDVPERLGGWANRLGTYGLKLAMVYQAAMGPEANLTIGEEALGYATRFVDFVKDYLAEVVQHDLAFDDDDKERNKVVKVLRKFPGQRVQHGAALRGSRLPARKFKSVIETLEEEGRVEVADTARGQSYLWLGE